MHSLTSYEVGACSAADSLGASNVDTGQRAGLAYPFFDPERSVKLRIRDNSVRLRLSQSEVAQLNDCGAVSAQTSFPGQSQLSYAVQAGPDRTAPRAVFANDAIVVTFPSTEVARWAESQEVTLRAEVDAGQDILVVLVEKDFACLSPRAEEDESDMFPHPEAGSRTC